jgi:hypothetical protein
MAKQNAVAATLQRGSILWVFLEAPDGTPILDDLGNPKSRPTMVITPTEDIRRGEPISLAAISTSFDAKRPLPTCWFTVPSEPRPGGHLMTGLDQPSVVKASWLKRLDPARIDSSHPIKRAPTQVAKQVINWLNQRP